MRDFNNNNSFGGSRGGDRFGGRDSGKPRFNSRNSGGNTMHDAVCAECGNNCKVPFFPSGNKPVYCSNCFEQRDGGNDNDRAPRRNNFDRPQFSEKRSFSAPAPRFNNQEGDSKKFDQVNAKLDKIIKTLNYMINLNKDVTPEENQLPAMVNELASIMEAEGVEPEAVTETPVKKAKKPRAKKAVKAE
jgi:CxxC-x17-CxxC domain-containing protein